MSNPQTKPIREKFFKTVVQQQSEYQNLLDAVKRFKLADENFRLLHDLTMTASDEQDVVTARAILAEYRSAKDNLFITIEDAQ